MGSPFETITSKFIPYHQKLENYLLDLKKAATPFNSAAIFLVGVFLFFSISKLPLKETNLFEILSINKDFFIKQMAANSFWGLTILLSYPLVLSFITQRLSKVKYNIVSMFFFLGFACLLLFFSQITWAIFFHLLNPFNLDFLATIVTVLAIYVIILSFKIIIKLDLISFIINHFISINISLLAMVVLAFLINSFFPPQIEYMYPMTELRNNSDGSFTLSFINILNSTRAVAEECNIQFPSGWKADPIEFRFENISNNENTSFFTFVYYPGGVARDLLRNQKEYYLNRKKDGTKKDDLFTIESIDLYFTGLHTEVLDVTWSDPTKTKIIREVWTRSVPNLGYYALFKSNFGQDKDLYYILNNSKCTKYY